MTLAYRLLAGFLALWPWALTVLSHGLAESDRQRAELEAKGIRRHGKAW